MSNLDNYDLKALILDYAKAKTDFDRHQYTLDADAGWRDRYNRLRAIEQLIIQLSGVTP